MQTPETAPENRPELMCRRLVLRKTMVFVGGGLILGESVFGATAAMASGGKVSQAQAGYKNSPRGGLSCDKCLQFQPPSACKIVDGSVVPSGSCNFFAARPK
jgi:hypothetical protein